MVFQKGALFNRSVRQNIAYGLKQQRLPSREIRNQVDWMLERLNLSTLADQNALTLSGGETQRTALARAMVLKPGLLLLDEPTANLDPHSAALMEGIIREGRSESNATVVLATHNMQQARRLSDRVIFLSEGRLVEHSATNKFFTAPSDIRSWDFVNGGTV